MTIRQLSLFLENKPKALRVPTRLLAKAGISILTMSLADTEQFGILRLIVADPDRAREVLEEAGCLVDVVEVLAVEVPDKPGGLDGIVAAIEQNDLNVEYVYSFTLHVEDRSVLVFRFYDPVKAAKLLQAEGIRLVTNLQAFERGQN